MQKLTTGATSYFNHELRCVPPVYPDSYGEVFATNQFVWSSNQNGSPKSKPFVKVDGSAITGDAVLAFPGDRIFDVVTYVSYGTCLNTHKWVLHGYLVDSE